MPPAKAMFGTVLISVCTAMHLYVSWRTYSVPFVGRHVPAGIFIALSAALWVVFFLGRVVGHGGTGPAAAAVEFLGMSWMGVLLLTFLPLFTVDLATFFGTILPRFSSALRGTALTAGLVLSAVALFQGMRPPVVENADLRLAGLPAALDGTVIVGLSDMHLGSLLGPRWLAARIAQVEAQQPDMVVLLGDIFEGHGAPDARLIRIFRELSPPLGVWAVFGNHESYGGGRLAPFQEAGVSVLVNRWAEVRPGLVLAGVEDLTAARRSGRDAGAVLRALAGRPPGATVLLSHTPWLADEAAGAGVGLMLSGHTHGGQIWPFGYLVRRWYPFFEGRYEVGETTVIVSRGTGTWGPRMRLFSPGQILRVILHPKAAAGAVRTAGGMHRLFAGESDG